MSLSNKDFYPLNYMDIDTNFKSSEIICKKYPIERFSTIFMYKEVVFGSNKKEDDTYNIYYLIIADVDESDVYTSLELFDDKHAYGSNVGTYACGGFSFVSFRILFDNVKLILYIDFNDSNPRSKDDQEILKHYFYNTGVFDHILQMLENIHP